MEQGVVCEALRVAEMLEKDHVKGLVSHPCRGADKPQAQKRGQGAQQQLIYSEGAEILKVGLEFSHKKRCTAGLVKNPTQNRLRSKISGVILLASMLVCLAVIATARREVEDVDDPQTPSEWIVRAVVLEQAGDSRGAERAARAALARDPWNPAAVRALTEILLRRGDDDALADWMDDLILGDARLAEQNFLLAEFAPKRDHPPFQALFREARIQARD